MFRFRILILLFYFSGNSAFSQTAPTAKEVLTKMLTGIENLRTARYVLQKEERMGKKYAKSEIIVKLNTSPQKVYIYSVEPNPGAEVLYVKGENNDNVMVKTNKFPFVTINLNPHNSLLRSSQHHTMTDAGFNYLSKIITANMESNPETFYNSLSSDGIIEFKGRQYHKLIIDNKNFGYTNYTVKKGDKSLVNIAEKLKVSDYMILSMNPSLTDYNDVRPGQKLKVPNSYAKRIILYVDKIYNLPLVQFIYDDKGLFEYYEMSSFIPNPTFQPDEFSPSFKDYKF